MRLCSRPFDPLSRAKRFQGPGVLNMFGAIFLSCVRQASHFATPPPLLNHGQFGEIKQWHITRMATIWRQARPTIAFIFPPRTNL